MLDLHRRLLLIGPQMPQSPKLNTPYSPQGFQCKIAISVGASHFVLPSLPCFLSDARPQISLRASLVHYPASKSNCRSPEAGAGLNEPFRRLWPEWALISSARRHTSPWCALWTPGPSTCLHCIFSLPRTHPLYHSIQFYPFMTGKGKEWRKETRKGERKKFFSLISTLFCSIFSLFKDFLNCSVQLSFCLGVSFSDFLKMVV